MAETGVAPDVQASITKEFLESALKRKIVKFTASAGTKPGDNFMCILISLEIFLEDQDEPLYLIMKTFPNHPTRRKLLEDSNTHLKEFQMYSIWLPELIEFQKSTLKPDKLVEPAMAKFWAGATIDYSSDPSNWSESDPIRSNYLIMTDVRKSYGFQMADKLKSLGYHHVKTVLTALATYHALGHAYKVHNKLPKILDKFPFMDDRFYCHPSQRPMMVATMKVSIQVVMDACKDFLEKNPGVRESLRKFEDAEFLADILALFMDPKGVDEKMMEGLMRAKPSGEPLQDQWVTSCHGDCWTNNILFKEGDDGNVNECVLVDLQEIKECCIMHDLVYFLYTSTDTDFRKQYLPEMLKLYFDTFVHYCGVLKVPPFSGYTFKNFLRKFQRSKLFGFLLASFVLPIVLQKPEAAVDMDSVEIKGEEDEKPTDIIWAEMLKKGGVDGKDEDDAMLLRERFSKMMGELQDEGVL